jgi:hypothetical protein
MRPPTLAAAAPTPPASAAVSVPTPPSPGTLQSAAGEPAVRREKRPRRHGQQESAEAAQTGRPQAVANGGQRPAGQQSGEAEPQPERAAALKSEEAKEKEEKSQPQPPPLAEQTEGGTESKRRRRKRKEGESEEAVAAAPASAASPLPPQPSSAPLFRPEDLQCGVCFELPAGRDALQIFQCINGHLLCQPCFQKVNARSREEDVAATLHQYPLPRC